MFTFYAGIPKIIYNDEGTISLDIDGFGMTVSGSSRDKFINAGINTILEELGENTIGSGNEIFIKYTVIKNELEKIRYTTFIHETNEAYIDNIINNAIAQYGEDKIYCYFS